MPFTPEELAQLGTFIEQKVKAVIDDATPVIDEAAAAMNAEAARTALVGSPDVHPEAGPLYYIHLANGEVVRSHDSASTHMPGADGTTQVVIGRYQIPS